MVQCKVTVVESHHVEGAQSLIECPGLVDEFIGNNKLYRIQIRNDKDYGKEVVHVVQSDVRFI